MSEKKKYSSTMEWWAAEENKEFLDKYLSILGELAECLELVGREQKLGVEDDGFMVDPTAEMQRCLIELLRQQSAGNTHGMLIELIKLKHHSEAMLVPTQIGVAVEKSVEIFKEVHEPPPELRAAIAAAFGGGGDDEALGDVLRERMEKSVEGQEGPNCRHGVPFGERCRDCAEEKGK